MAFILVKDASDSMCEEASRAGLTLADLMDVGFSPIVVETLERVTPLLQRLADRYRYSLDWQLGPNEASDEVMAQPQNQGLTRSGKATLRAMRRTTSV